MLSARGLGIFDFVQNIDCIIFEKNSSLERDKKPFVESAFESYVKFIEGMCTESTRVFSRYLLRSSH